MDKFWNVWIEGTEGGSHHKHESFENARGEAERLARLSNNRGRKVYVLECLVYCEVSVIPVEWHEVN